MTTQSTIDKLIEMRLTAMSDAFRTQISDPKMKEVSFEDRFGMLVDIEYSNRKSNSLKRLIRNVRGKVILQPHGKEFFTWYSKHLFTLHGKHFFT